MLLSLCVSWSNAKLTPKESSAAGGRSWERSPLFQNHGSRQKPQPLVSPPCLFDTKLALKECRSAIGCCSSSGHRAAHCCYDGRRFLSPALIENEWLPTAFCCSWIFGCGWGAMVIAAVSGFTTDLWSVSVSLPGHKQKNIEYMEESVWDSWDHPATIWQCIYTIPTQLWKFYSLKEK